MLMTPSSVWTRPAMAPRQVDLPAPFSPMSAWMLPALMSRSMPFNASVPPYRFRTCLRRTAGWSLATSTDELVATAAALTGARPRVLTS
jgi:hypothetical protein